MGSTRGDNTPVNFSWSSDNAVSGSMTATLVNGESFAGRFFQVTSDTESMASCLDWLALPSRLAVLGRRLRLGFRKDLAIVKSDAWRAALPRRYQRPARQ